MLEWYPVIVKRFPIYFGNLITEICAILAIPIIVKLALHYFSIDIQFLFRLNLALTPARKHF